MEYPVINSHNGNRIRLVIVVRMWFMQLLCYSLSILDPDPNYYHSKNQVHIPIKLQIMFSLSNFQLGPYSNPYRTWVLLKIGSGSLTDRGSSDWTGIHNRDRILIMVSLGSVYSSCQVYVVRIIKLCRLLIN